MEYTSITLTQNDDLLANLNAYGQQGWVLVLARPTSSQNRTEYIFVREIAA